MKYYSHLSWSDRLKIEKMLLEKYSISQIASAIHVHRSTIYREIKRGMYYHTRSADLLEEKRYSPDLAQSRYEANLKAKGVAIKLAENYDLAMYLENKIANEKYSPAAALASIKKEGLDFGMTLCVGTLYNYIDKDVFGALTNADLPVKSKRKNKGYKRVTTQKRLIGTSIEKRDEEVLTRNDFGHWEMDTVKGEASSSYSMLVLTERKTRYELIFKIRHLAKSVVEVLDKLEIIYGSDFKKIFKTITMDNGAEFSYTKQLKTSIKNSEEERVSLYYCHSYSSWERGSNENLNKMIRRHIPKGQDFDQEDESVFKKIQDWINLYPRKIFNWNCSKELFDLELTKI